MIHKFCVYRVVPIGHMMVFVIVLLILTNTDSSGILQDNYTYICHRMANSGLETDMSIT